MIKKGKIKLREEIEHLDTERKKTLQISGNIRIRYHQEGKSKKKVSKKTRKLPKKNKKTPRQKK